jgi:hypothetical protein
MFPDLFASVLPCIRVLAFHTVGYFLTSVEYIFSPLEFIAWM